MTARIAILISGRGSNMESLLKACAGEGFPAEVALVLSNRPKAKGLETAAGMGVPTDSLDHTEFDDREAFDAALSARLKEADIDYICLAGFMRLLGAEFIKDWQDKILNIHPSLLPAFKGLNTHERAIEQGVKLHGCTVHFVREDMDDGPIIGQAAVPVLPGDTAESLAARVLAAEHQLFPACLAMVASGQAGVRRDKVSLPQGTEPTGPGPLMNPAPVKL